MNVLEMYVQADDEGAEALASAFNEYAYGGAVIEQTVTPEPGETLDPVRPFTVRAFLLMDESAEVKRRALELAVWHLAQLRPLGDLRVRELEEADWANAWKKFYRIMHVGQHTVIKPSWLDYAARPGEIVLELDPGMAFGTGLHPSTRLCLTALERYMTPGARVLDVGTGSGILAIAAAKLGASAVRAVDTDAIAVETARKNVELNGMQHIVTVEAGSIATDSEPYRANLISVNILAEVIADLSVALTHHLARGGTIISSGILADKVSIVEQAWHTLGLRVIDSSHEEDWLMLVGRIG